ncbi:hypothetical protein apy_08150 [Aeropyrum pernix]|uniref:Uncharacterized protein n=1 Tax=Aeropyrum pernix TaxID=56636 RepID=A0A401H9M3_AERPX|nr:hypothetical protein apy_08150 [Aeropyrum pernix]
MYIPHRPAGYLAPGEESPYTPILVQYKVGSVVVYLLHSAYDNLPDIGKRLPWFEKLNLYTALLAQASETPPGRVFPGEE